jgi:ubiquinone/menaquinone biosynthesis C-methylase UbiE
VISGQAALREAYRDETVARTYLENRFVEPIGALLHDRQLEAVLRVIDRERPQRILELAPGPARLTRDVARRSRTHGVMVDASGEMLAEAKRRLADDADRWRAVQGDAFALPVIGCVDLVYTFRLIRHFEAADRERLYREIARVLRPGGSLVFDAVNARVSERLRAAAPSAYQHYDALLTPDALGEELTSAGFTLLELQGVQHRYTLLHRLQVLVAPRSRRIARFLIDRIDALGGEPLEWVAICRRA